MTYDPHESKVFYRLPTMRTASNPHTLSEEQKRRGFALFYGAAQRPGADTPPNDSAYRGDRNRLNELPLTFSPGFSSFLFFQ